MSNYHVLAVLKLSEMCRDVCGDIESIRAADRQYQYTVVIHDIEFVAVQLKDVSS